MKNDSGILFLLVFMAFLLASCDTSTDSATGRLDSSANTALLHIADDSFESNSIDARFIPVLDDAENVRLGARFDTLTGKIVGGSPCIASYDEGDNGNQGFNMRLTEITDNYSQMKALDIDVSVQGSYLGATGNAKAQFARSQSFTQQTQKFLLYAKAERKPKTIVPSDGTLFGLTTDANTALGKRQTFRKLCGDAFVVAIFEGIEMFGMLNFTGISQAEQKKVSASMGGSYGGWSASASASSAVSNASSKGNVEISVQLGGRCDAVGNLGGDTETRWNNMVNAGGKLQDCAQDGGNITTYKVVPYSSTFIRDWPFDDDDDPKLNQLLYYYDAYGAVLDSIGTLLTNRGSAYKVALLNRGVELSKLDDLATTVRQQREDIKRLLNNCQGSSDPADREAACQNDTTLKSAVEQFVHPYVYRAQLPLYFVGDKPAQAFLSNPEIAADILRENVQYPRDVACAFADSAGLSNYPGCPIDFPGILSQAKSAIGVSDFPWLLDAYYVFQTQSTSNDLCMVAPDTKKIVTASKCNLGKPSSARQRMLWMKSGQLRYRSSGSSGQCVSARDSAACDSVQAAQLWRFVPSQANDAIGLLQNADGLCLAHSNVDRNVTYRACDGDLNEKFYQWKPMQVK